MIGRPSGRSPISCGRRSNGASYAPGDRLPSEATLIQHYGVARMTVRQAIQELRTEGRVVAEHGRGVFVRQPAPVRRLASDRFLRRHRDAGQAAFLAEADKSGVRPRVDQIEVTTAAPPTDVRERLRLTDGEQVVVRSRRYLADGRPVETAVSYLPLRVAEGTADHRGEHRARAGSTPAWRKPATSSATSPRRSPPACPPPTSGAAWSSPRASRCSSSCVPPTTRRASPSRSATRQGRARLRAGVRHPRPLRLHHPSCHSSRRVVRFAPLT